MKNLIFQFLITFLMLSNNSFCQSKSLSGKVLKQLDSAEKEMVNALTSGDSAAFRKVVGDEYLDINAMGTIMTLKPMLREVSNFKGSSINFSEQSQRVYGSFVLRNGRAKFYFGGQQVGEVFYTEGWIYRNNRWQFVHWQGTMTKEFAQAK